MATTNKSVINNKQIKIDLLKSAKELVANGTEPWICCAIDYAAFVKRVCTPAQQLRKYIHAALDEETFYTGWLKQNGHPYDAHSAKQGRLAWIDWMVACLEEDINELKGNV